MNKTFSINNISSVYSYSWDDTFVFDGESHPQWEVVFVESGNVCVTEQESVYYLSENNIIFHAPMEFHKIRSVELSEPRVKIFTFFANGDLPEQLKNGVFTLNSSEKQEFLKTFELLQTFFHNHEPEDFDLLEVRSRLTAFLIRVARNSSEERLSKSTGAATYRQIVTSMINQIEENLSITDLAKKNFISVSYMKFLFAKYAGISPKSYHIHLRIHHANELFKMGYSVLEVSDKMNFSSPNYFSAFYKKQTGVSPKKSRTKLLNIKTADLITPKPDKSGLFLEENSI